MLKDNPHNVLSFKDNLPKVLRLADLFLLLLSFSLVSSLFPKDLPDPNCSKDLLDLSNCKHLPDHRHLQPGPSLPDPKLW